MQFHKFTEIENLTPDFIERVREHGFDKDCAEWYVALKMDGSNFQVAVDEEGNVHYGSRNQELGRYDNFNNYQAVVERFNIASRVTDMKQLWIESQKTYVDNKILVGSMLCPVTFIAFFELIGGVYRHKDVEPDKHAVKMQGRVNYCPDNRMVCFDIFVYIHTPNGDGIGYYLSPDDVAFFCAQAGLYSQLIMFRGTFDEAIAYPNDYQDELGHLLFGLPKLEDNVVEGNVIKPGRELRFRNGERVIVKNKNKIFLERGHKTNRIKHPTEPMNELEQSWYDTVSEYVTESRLHSVLSKMDLTSIGQKDFGSILKAFMEDVLKDFNHEHGGQIQVLEGEHPVSEFNFHKITKACNKDATEMIRPIFIEMLQKRKHEESHNE